MTPRPELATVWVTGAAGLIGACLVRLAPQALPGAAVRALTRAELDLEDFAAVRRRFAAERPDAVVHCAALSRSAECETDPARARRANVDVTAFLAELSAAVPFVFFSTDLVFDGRKGGYVETDAVYPLSVYGATKAEAEAAVLRNARHTVVRTSLNGGRSFSGQRAFNEELRRAWEQGKAPALFTDEFRSPIAAEVTARAVWEMVRQGLAGTFHLAGAERLSRYQIGELLAARWPQLKPRLRAASLTEYQGAPRPPDTSLDCAKLERELGWRLPGLTAWLEAHPAESF